MNKLDVSKLSEFLEDVDGFLTSARDGLPEDKKKDLDEALKSNNFNISEIKKQIEDAKNDIYNSVSSINNQG